MYTTITPVISYSIQIIKLITPATPPPPPPPSPPTPSPHIAYFRIFSSHSTICLHSTIYLPHSCAFSALEPTLHFPSFFFFFQKKRLLSKTFSVPVDNDIPPPEATGSTKSRRPLSAGSAGRRQSGQSTEGDRLEGSLSSPTGRRFPSSSSYQGLHSVSTESNSSPSSPAIERPQSCSPSIKRVSVPPNEEIVFCCLFFFVLFES